MKIKRLISLFLCVGVLLSCAKEIACDEEETTLRDGYKWLDVSLAMENTKTIISGAGSTKSIEWMQGDRIDFFWGSESEDKSTITVSVGGATANLRVQIPQEVTEVYAAYPSGAATFADGTLSFVMPGVESGEFSKVNFMASKIEADSDGKKTALFRSVVSFLKFNISDPNAQKIEIRVRAEENPVLRGTIPVTFDADDNIQIGEATDTHQSYTMNIGGAGDFYAPVLPGKKYVDGFELNYYVNNLNTKSYDVDFDFRLDRGYIASFGTVETLFEPNTIKDYYVTVNGAGKKDGSDWSNALGKDEFKEKIAGISISKDTDSEEVKAAENYLKNAIFHIEGGTYDFDELVVLGFSNHCKKYINFAFDGGYYNGSKDVQNHPTVFDGGGTHRIFELARYTDLAVMDCTFSHSSGSGGGQAAIRLESKYSKLNLSGCRLENNLNTATAGAINVGYGTVNLTNCTFSGNSATYGAAVNVDNAGKIDLTGEVVISNCTFDGNSATDAGGALRLSEGGPVSVTGCEFYNNSSKFGGAVHAGKANSTFTNCIFGSPDNGNTATGSGARGGAVRCSGDSGNHVFNNCTFSSNRGGYGGAIFMEDFSGTVTVNGGTFTANHAASSSGIGGGIYQSSGTLSVDGATFSENTTEASGGALGFNNGVATLTACTFTGNTSKTSGGALDFINGVATLTACTFTGNTSTTYGAAVYATNGTLTLTNCVIGTADSGNTATKSGGAFRFQDGAGSAELNNCTIAYNASSSNGGAISLASSYTGSVTINGGSISNCSATGNNNGGAIRQEGGTIIADGLHIDGCSAANGAAYSISGGSATFTECILGKDGRNSASSQGGCIHMINSAAPEFAGCYIRGNGDTGGGVRANGTSHPSFTNCQFVDCLANNGGAVYVDNNAYPTFSGCLFQECKTSSGSGKNGGGIYINSTAACPVIENCTFEGNTAGYGGGAIYSGSTYTDGISINGCTFTDNYAPDEGAGINVRNSCTYNITNCDFHDNYGPWGTVYVGSNSTVNLVGGNMTENIGKTGASGSYKVGAAIYGSENSKVTCDGVVFDGNEAKEGPLYHCGGNNNITAWFNSCVIRNNHWTATYGCLINMPEGKTGVDIAFNNCSFFDNYLDGNTENKYQGCWFNLNNFTGKILFTNSTIWGYPAITGQVNGSGSTNTWGFLRFNTTSTGEVYLVNDVFANTQNGGRAFTMYQSYTLNTDYSVLSNSGAQGSGAKMSYNGEGNITETDVRGTDGTFTFIKDVDYIEITSLKGVAKDFVKQSTETINGKIRSANSGFYDWLSSIGALGKDCRGKTRNSSANWPGAYDKDAN